MLSSWNDRKSRSRLLGAVSGSKGWRASGFGKKGWRAQQIARERHVFCLIGNPYEHRKHALQGGNLFERPLQSTGSSCPL
eukprot:561682-Prymnesium_polylepis.1